MRRVVNDQQKTTLGKVLRYIKRYWGYLGVSIVLAAVTVALTLYLPILIGQAVYRYRVRGRVGCFQTLVTHIVGYGGKQSALVSETAEKIV